MSIRIIAELKAELDVANKELAEVKEERDRLQLILKADSEHIVEIEAERDRYKLMVKDAHVEGYHDGYQRLGSKEHCWEISDTRRELEAK